MKIYALLIGINNYPKELEMCVSDTERMEAYLNDLGFSTKELHVKRLNNEAATKNEVVHYIKEHLGKAKDEDVALLYFSGHGAYELSDGRFIDEHDGLLECMVCHYESDQKSGYLLADKEIRFLFSQFSHSPHLISVFDCCHSGNMVKEDNGTHKVMKRLSKKRPPREWSEFVFHGSVKEDLARLNTTEKLIPFKNHVHIAACTSEQSAWENWEGGIFTNYLLNLLEATKNNLTYREVTRFAKISIRETTKTLQTPTISVQGSGKMNSDSKWLKLTKKGEPRNQATIVYNNELGWKLDMGTLMGIKKDTKVFVKKGDKKKELLVKEPQFEYSILKSPDKKEFELEISNTYSVTVESIFSPLNLFVNDLDHEKEDKAQIQALLKDFPNVVDSGPETADLFLNLFNQFVYFSFPNDPFRPIGKQIDLLELLEKSSEIEKQYDSLKKQLVQQINKVIKWSHFNSLENPDPGFSSAPISVKILLDGATDWIDITNGEIDINPYEERAEIGVNKTNKFLRKYQIKVRNISQENLYVGVLTLGSDMSIGDPAWDKEVIRLEPDQEKYFFDHKATTFRGLSLEPFQEVYNWPYEWITYKFIFNTYEDFTPSLPEYLQTGLEKPYTLATLEKESSKKKGDEEEDDIQDSNNNWGTLASTLKLINPEYNLVSSDLKDNWDGYLNSEALAPFISQLYFEQVFEGFSVSLVRKPFVPKAKLGLAKGFQTQLFIGNNWSNFIRKRKFQKALTRLPESSPGKPIVVAEGDSWFLYPIRVKDIVDYVMEKYPVRSLAKAGDELQNYRNDGQLIKVVKKLQPKYVMLSGGGNDIIGPEIADLLHKDIPAGSHVKEYLNETFSQRMDELKELYDYFIQELKGLSVKKLIIHGYDYIKADHEVEVLKNGFVNKHMIEKGITEVEDRKRLIAFLVDTFNELLRNLSHKYEFVTYLDLRGLVGENEWYDEIHPNDEGNRKLSQCFLAEIK